MTQEELIAALQRRDADALDYFQRHYGPLMRYIVAPILPDAADREELVNDAAHRVWEKIEDFDTGRGSFKAWVTAITRNLAVDRARRLPPQAEQIPPDHPAPHSDPEEQLLKKEQEKQLQLALLSLSEEDRILFYRKYYYRQSTAQIAAETGTTVRAVEGRLYRIRSKLRERMEGEGYGR